MTARVVRFEDRDGQRWGVVQGDRVLPIEGDYPSTRDFMLHGAERARRLDAVGPNARPLEGLRILCPITPDRQFLCQAINYASHMRESGFDPATNPFNIFFRKASSCLAPADTDIVCPAHVEFLDYEAEIGLVFARDVDRPVEVTAANLHEFVGALVAVDDVTARDVQLSEGQFYKSKSYRTFGPVGPFLTLVDRAALARFDSLRLRLSVNGAPRQDALASDMVHKPPATLTELAAVQGWEAGDLLATGTPGGCALKAPPTPIRLLVQSLAPLPRSRIVRRSARANPRRLKPGDLVELSIRTDDGGIDLGAQRNRVVAAGGADAARTA